MCWCDCYVTHANTHTTVLLLFWNMSGTTWVSRYQTGNTRKVKTNLDLLEQEIVSVNGICWAMCKSAPHPRQPRQHPTTQFFYRPDALPAAQPTASKHWKLRWLTYCPAHSLVQSIHIAPPILSCRVLCGVTTSFCKYAKVFANLQKFSQTFQVFATFYFTSVDGLGAGRRHEWGQCFGADSPVV